MLATGSRTESWSLTWDDSNLPEGWSFQSSSGQNTNPTLTPGIAQNFDFLASVPADALGDDNSYVGLTLTLDSNNNVYKHCYASYRGTTDKRIVYCRTYRIGHDRRLWYSGQYCNCMDSS